MAMMRILLLAVTILLVEAIATIDELQADLLDGRWFFRNRSSNNPLLSPLKGPASPPGDIYADLRAIQLIDDPQYGDNDVRLRWVARENWTYSTTFDASPEILKKRSHLLVFEGLDTIAIVELNGRQILTTNNQFVRYTADVTGDLKLGSNHLEVHFDSPIHYADSRAKAYMSEKNYTIPPDCPPEMYNGECHANYIRKVQAQFSWDWGPAFPTVGITGPVRLIGHDGLHMEVVHVDVIFEGQDDVAIQVNADVLSSKKGDIHWDVIVTHLLLHNAMSAIDVGSQTISTRFILDRNDVELWWPNGWGSQKLYTLNVKLTREDKTASCSGSVRFGVRKVELIQSLVDERNASAGRNFYFKINDRPIFLKGSNWIPASPFPARNNKERVEFLLESVRSTGMNAMRVWGGGRYEDDAFYDMADEKGILLWHDMMFACSLYPADAPFLYSVAMEVTQNVKRIKSHASVLVWAGNNENEIGLTGGWWPPSIYGEEQRAADYKALYKGVIEKTILAIDSTRPFVLSSPSNGIETEKAGGISNTPSDVRYGDIHFYNEFKNLWRDSSYDTPRCTTEYGLQSLPAGATLSKYIPPSEYHYLSGNLTHRQHHPGGRETLVTMTFSHFPLPADCEATARTANGMVMGATATACIDEAERFLDRFAYFTQFHQALTYKTETEHYLRFRGRLNADGLGNTMCALYWQLNDVWAAPTWSSIDWDLRWKPAHYEARRFFAPQMVILYFNDHGIALDAYAINDRAEAADDVTVLVRVLAFKSNFTPVFSTEKKINLPPFSSTPIDLADMNEWLSPAFPLEEFVFTAQIIDVNGQRKGYQTTVIPDKLYKVNLNGTGDVNLVHVEQSSDLEYKLVLEATAIAPLVWMEVRVQEVLGFFNDNAFTMTEATREIVLTLSKPINRSLTAEDFYVCAIRSCFT